MTKDLKVLFRRCEVLGCEVRKRRNNHYVVITPWGAKIFVGGTLSDHRAMKNIISDMRKMGLKI